jgi:hypothetical protein
MQNAFTDDEIEKRSQLPLVNGYDTHRIVTICRSYTYEMPTKYDVVKTARGGWWGVATFADGSTLKKFRGKPARIIGRSSL